MKILILSTFKVKIEIDAKSAGILVYIRNTKIVCLVLNICTIALAEAGVVPSKLSSNNETSDLDSSRSFFPERYVKHMTFEVCDLCLLFSS